MNNLLDKNITLERDTHKYQLKLEPDIHFTSVTTYISKFFEEFDSEKIATNLVRNNRKYSNYTVDSLISEWNAAAEYGTKIHNEIEDWISYGIEPKEPKAKVGKEWIDEYRSKSNIDVLSEIILYSKELKIAGTIDVLAKDNKSDEYVLIDWKTSKKITTVSYKYKTGNHDATKNVMDCNFYHYSLQMSLYRYILEEYYGLTVRNQVIAHIKDDGVDAHLAPYMRKEIMMMLEYINDIH